MPYLEIKKGSKVRRVFAPNKKQKSYLRSICPCLHVLQEIACNPHGEEEDAAVVHGFMHGRSALTNAARHVGGFEFTISMDLKDFFPSVTFGKVLAAWRNLYGPSAKIPEVFTLPIYVDKKTGNIVSPVAMRKWQDFDEARQNELIAEQGLPTSPMLANIAASLLDWEIIGPKVIYGGDVYTRYADDLTVSSAHGIITPSEYVEAIKSAVEYCGFQVSEKKTKIQLNKSGRRIITGYSVGGEDVRPTRTIRRKLRAAEHNGWNRKRDGLHEFCKLCMPKSDAKIDKAPYDLAVKLLRWGCPVESVLARFTTMKKRLEDTIATMTTILEAKDSERGALTTLTAGEKLDRCRRHIEAVDSAIAVCEIAKSV